MKCSETTRFVIGELTKSRGPAEEGREELGHHAPVHEVRTVLHFPVQLREALLHHLLELRDALVAGRELRGLVLPSLSSSRFSFSSQKCCLYFLLLKLFWSNRNQRPRGAPRP